jgi:hypothetical protein
MSAKRPTNSPIKPAQRPQEQSILIIAGTHQQAKYWAEQLKVSNWLYIHRPEQLYGRTKCDIRFIGTWYERSDADQLERLVRELKLIG